MTKQQQIKIESSKRMKTNERGEGVPDGERYTLYHTAGGKTFRTSTYYGNKTAQERALKAAQEDMMRAAQHMEIEK